MSEFVKCLQCGETVLVDFKAFEKIKCDSCLLEITKKLISWCQCSHAGVDHANAIPKSWCRLCDCLNFVWVQDLVTDEYDKRLSYFC